jgi:hypothetical protein
MPLHFVILYGSVREARQGIKAARFVVDQLGRRGHATTLIDPLEKRLPLLDRMYKEYKKGEAPAVLEALATTYRATDGFVRGIQSWHSASAEEPAGSFPRGVFLSTFGHRLLFGGRFRRRARRNAIADDLG